MQKHPDSPRDGRNGYPGEEMEGGMERDKEPETLINVDIEFEDKVVIFCEASFKIMNKLYFFTLCKSL